MTGPLPPSSVPQGDQPARVLGPIDATCVVVGAIIGVGIFFNPSQVAALCPSMTMALLAWGIGGAIALCGALAFAELGGMYHGSGAQYTLLRDSYGPFPAFLYVFCLTTIIEPGSIGVMAVICSQNLLAVVGFNEPSGEFVLLIGIALILSVTVANIIGVRWGSRIQNVSVYAKVFALLAVTVLAMFFAPTEVPPSDAQATAKITFTGGLLAALVPILFAFGGWQQVLWLGGEVRQPRRNLPLSIIVGVLIVIVVYLLVNWAYLRLLGVGGVATSDALAADAVGVVWPDFGRTLAAAAVAISAFGVLNVQLLTAPRMIFGMAQDRRFFTIFATVSHTFRTPVAAILLLMALAMALLFAARSNAVNQLVNAVVMVDSVFFVLTGVAVIVLRYKRPTADRPIRVPGYPIVPLLFVLGEIGAIVGAYLEPGVRIAALLSAGWIAVAALIYLIWFANRNPVPVVSQH